MELETIILNDVIQSQKNTVVYTHW
jgi:hypothetical protein